MSDETINVGDRFELAHFGGKKQGGTYIGDRMRWDDGTVSAPGGWDERQVREGLKEGRLRRLPTKAKPPEPRKPTDGAWRYREDGKLYRFDGKRYMYRETPIGWCIEGGGGVYFRNGAFEDGTLEYVGEGDEPGAVDWKRWLPPHSLSDTGPKEFHEGQVWAWRGILNDPIVFRVGVVIDRPLILARPEHEDTVGTVGRVTMAGKACGKAVLVQDVGEATPRDPAVLYGPTSVGKRVQCPGCKNWTNAGMWAPPFCSKECHGFRDQGAAVAAVAKATNDGTGKATRAQSAPPLPESHRPEPATYAPTGCTLLTRSGIQCDERAGHRGPCKVHPFGERPRPEGVSAAELAQLAAGPWRRRK